MNNNNEENNKNKCELYHKKNHKGKDCYNNKTAKKEAAKSPNKYYKMNFYCRIDKQ